MNNTYFKLEPRNGAIKKVDLSVNIIDEPIELENKINIDLSSERDFKPTAKGFFSWTMFKLGGTIINKEREIVIQSKF